MFQKVVVRAPSSFLRINEAQGWCWWNCLEKWMWFLCSRSRSYIRRIGRTCLSSLGGCTFAGMPRGLSTLNTYKANPILKTPRGCLFCQHYEGFSLIHRFFFSNHIEIMQVFSDFSLLYTWNTVYHTFLSLFNTQFWSASKVPDTVLRNRKQSIMVNKIMFLGVIHAYIVSQLCHSLMESRASILTPLVLICVTCKMVKVIAPFITQNNIVRGIGMYVCKLLSVMHGTE